MANEGLVSIAQPAGWQDARWTIPSPGGAVRLQAPAALMGILNCTPDSFSDGGAYDSTQAVVEQAGRMVDAGAQWLDIGGESTRPGAPAVSAREEWQRVGPVLTALRHHFPQALLSIDTQKAAIAAQALDVGVAMVNDVSAGRDPAMLPLLASYPDTSYCLMHMRGSPQTMQAGQVVYGDVVAEVTGFLQQAQQACVQAGISADRLLVDPGIGFGKTPQHNVALLQALGHISQTCQAPVLLGLSRKSLLPALVGQDCDLAQRDGLSHVLHAQLQWHCALLRIHDVAGARLACTMLQAYHDLAGKE